MFLYEWLYGLLHLLVTTSLTTPVIYSIKFLVFNFLLGAEFSRAQKRSAPWKSASLGPAWLKWDQLRKKNQIKTLDVLSRVTKHMDLNNRRILTKLYITSQFSYCPWRWIFCSRNIENRVNPLMHNVIKWPNTL